MLQSLGLHFDAIEDRLLLRLADGALETPGIDLLLTRRVCAALRGELQQLADASAQAPERLDAVAKATVSAIHHQALASQVSMRREPAKAAGPRSPPQLVTGVTCGRRRGDGKWVVRFELRDQPTVTLTLSDQTLHGLIDLLRRQIVNAGWALPAIPADTPPDERGKKTAAQQFH